MSSSAVALVEGDAILSENWELTSLRGGCVDAVGAVIAL